MKITALKRQVKNPGRVSVMVDAEYSFSLSLDELVKHRLKNGDELTASDVKKYKKISADGKLRARALEWLLNRPRSEREFRDYLYKKKAEPDQIDGLVTEFTDKSYLDNTKFTEWYAELLTRRNKSDRQIRAELFKKGIARELVDSVLEQNAGKEEQRLKEIVAKKGSLPRYKNDPLKLKQYLARQGFSYNAINEALKNT